MSDTATRDDTSTIADYEAFMADQVGDERWELVRGRLVGMTNPSESHEQIVGGIFAPLRAAMNAAGCRVYAGGMRVQRSEDRGDDMAVIPDIVVRCGPRRDRHFVTDPLVVVEVLSRSTLHHDRSVKFDVYRSLPSLQHIVLVYQDQMRVEHFRRGAAGWAVEVLSSPSRRLVLDAIDFTVDLDTIYFDVPVLRPVEVPGGRGGAADADRMTLADDEVFVASRPDDERWELIGGALEMMTNPLLNHGLIIGNIFAPLKVKLAGGDCRAFAGGLRVQRSEAASDTFATIPDIVGQCGPRPNRAFTLNAVSVVEVLSRSTMFRDRGAKFDVDRSLPSLRDIVFVYQNQMRVERYRRTSEGWVLSESVHPSDTLIFDAVDAAIDLAAIYDDVPTLRSVAQGDEPPVPIR